MEKGARVAKAKSESHESWVESSEHVHNKVILIILVDDDASKVAKKFDFSSIEITTFIEKKNERI